MHIYKIAFLVCLVVLPWLLTRLNVAKSNEWTPPLGYRLLGIFLIVPALCFFAGYSKLDDSYIYARYIANALSGNGMVFNVGEHVNALTSPLFSYLLLLTSWLLKGRVLLAGAILSGIFILAACTVAEKRVSFAGLLLASTACFYILVGMESSLFILMLLVNLAAFRLKLYDWLPIACVLLILTRFEGGILVAVIAWQLFRRRTSPQPLAFIPAVLVGTCYLLLNHHFYGGYLPSSTTAKLGQGFSGYWGPWPTAFLGDMQSLELALGRTIYLVPVLCSCIVASFVTGSHKVVNHVVLPFCGLLLAFYVVMNLPGSYFWYFVPFILFGMLYAASAIPKTRTAAVIASALIALLVVANAYFLRQPQFLGRFQGYIEAGTWARLHTRVDARIASSEIGLFGWYSNRYLIDEIGLATPSNATHITHHDGSSWLAEDRPDYIVLHTANWPWEVVVKQSADYVKEPVNFTGGVYLVRRKDYSAEAEQADNHAP